MIELVRGRSRLAALAGAGCLVLAAGCGAERGGPSSAVAAPSAGASAVRSLPAPTGSAPAATPSPSAAGEPELGPGEGSLRVLTFRGYVEYGGSDPRVNWVSPFEAETGCRLARLDFARTSAEMAEMLESGDYDVVSAPPDLAGELIRDRAVVPIDPELVPAYGELPSWLRDLPAVNSGDTPYGVPYLWGFHRLAHDSAGGGPEGWNALFTGTDRVMLRDSPLTIADAALALDGVKDPFRLTSAQLDAAVALLAENRERFAYWSDPKDVVQGFAGGSVRLAQALPYHLDVLRRAGGSVREVSGLRGTGWVDAWMIPAEADSPNCAHRWLDWASSPEVQKQAAPWIGLAPAHPDACTGRARRMCDAYHVTDRKWLQRISFAVRPSGDCGGRNGECTDYAEWTKRWNERVR